MKKRAFTLVELLVVLAILGLVVATLPVIRGRDAVGGGLVGDPRRGKKG